jgi:hypothetical protein
MGTSFVNKSIFVWNGCTMLVACLFFNLEDGGEILAPKMGSLSREYMAIYLRSRNSS